MDSHYTSEYIVCPKIPPTLQSHIHDQILVTESSPSVNYKQTNAMNMLSQNYQEKLPATQNMFLDSNILFYTDSAKDSANPGFSLVGLNCCLQINL